jgi:hypothetical protein
VKNKEESGPIVKKKKMKFGFQVKEIREQISIN